MSKIGNYVIERQESDDFQFGWESAERGEPAPDWPTETVTQHDRLTAQKMGWGAYFREQQTA